MKTVLVVEDEKMIRQGICVMIRRSGVPVEDVIECSNGEIAWEILQERQVDVMFTDIRMPKINGIELVKKIQTLPHRPITIAISGYADFSYAVEMLRMGAREYILKPVEREKIREILQKLEEEIQAGQESSRTSKKLGYQQLKYLILNDQITEEEMCTIQAEYENEFSLQSFCVFAVNSGEDKEIGEEYIYLHNIEGNDIYLVPEEYAVHLLKHELAQEYVGISELHSSIKEIKEASAEAVEARHRAFCTNREVVYIKERGRKIPEALQEEGKKLMSAEMKLRRLQLLGTDKTEELVQSWRNFFRAVKNERIKCMAFEEEMDSFLTEVKKTYGNVPGDDEKILESLADYYRFSCLDSFEAAFMEWLIALHEHINSQYDTNKNKQKIKDAVDYIKENFDKDLNMAMVSNYISMNYSLFSYLFKEYTGKNFVNYLKNIRMEKAKKLLEETDMKIIEISQKVGYGSEKHFMKTFKAACGVSPSEYRKNAQWRK